MSLVAFLVICLILTIMGLTGQSSVQNTLTIYRFNIF